MGELVKLEAKKHAYRQTKDGVVISFVLHPNDVDAALAASPLGTVYALGIVEVPAGVSPGEVFAQDGEAQPQAAKQPREWLEMEPTQQAGIRCNEARFQLFICATSSEKAADYVRAFCGVTSRRDIKRGTKAAEQWAQLEKDYQEWLTSEQFLKSVRA